MTTLPVYHSLNNSGPDSGAAKHPDLLTLLTVKSKLTKLLRYS